MLSGPAHCIDCHDIAKGKPEFKCLDCHRDIRERLDEKRGFHPSLVGNDRTGGACVKCHSEHNGRSFELIHWDTPVQAFDHHRAGYTLEGKHAHLACRDCHQPSHLSPASRETLSAKDLSRTYLGLSTKCLGCHTDEHRGQLSTECSTCHDSLNWKGASAQFDHRRARFILTGGHERVSCDKCHTKTDDPKPYIKYKGLPFQDCAPCHNDPHKGVFPNACKSCHTSTSTWKPQQVTELFDHSKTDYPLEGKHTSVPCSACHLQQGDFKQPVAFAHCSDCHRKDPHGGQFADLAGSADCGACHKVDGFKPSTFGIARHAATKFPLQARHVQVPCSKCHIQTANMVVYRIRNTACSACHKDVHDAQFASAPYRNRCEACHTAKSFKPSTFTLTQHSSTRFPLGGAHMAVVCGDCHRQSPAFESARPVQFVFNDRKCTVCHNDPHHGQFAARMASVLPDGNPAGCNACHSTRAWKALQGFDHAATDFPLEGSHRAVPCQQCHRTDNLTTGLTDVSYASTPRKCSACHADIHGGQFSSGGQPADCQKCHRVLKWKPSTFDHDTQSTYKLDGAHRNVRCALCHTNRREEAGRMVVFYKPTPRDCSACHGSETAGN
jgi:hypothetical protein